MPKVIYLPTNLNKKLDCEAFVHIDLAPKNGIPGKLLEDTTIEIRTSDGSHEPVTVKVVNLYRFKLCDIRDFFTYPSHGLSALEYYSWYQNQHWEADHETNLAVYFYKKINE